MIVEIVSEFQSRLVYHFSGPHLPRQAAEPHRLLVQPHRGLLHQRGHQLLPGNAAQEDA